MTYRRILLKVSGEALGRPESGRGIDPDAIGLLCRQVAEVVRAGCGVAVVCGGGNILRGAELGESGAQRASADYMGMLATIINGLALSDGLESEGLDTRVLTAIEIHQVAEPFVRRRALAHLERGRVVILAGGLGVPLFTTDTAAAQRAVELRCDVLLKATKVSGVYSSDPVADPDAQLYDELSYMDVISKDLGVMDGTAITLCRENDLPVVVFDLFEEGNLQRVARGEDLGTKIGSGR
ncbi:MAG: UMP kinase [Planctomycetota bacterium]|jgi:uridylate kinase|nr:UMP kinase [Planctomycetota bacterium]MDP6762620.1 UMP kinase [Planctomycetota bacterium]MDP6990623.1 UMP kinase [Planctomycetota bacterium]